MSIRRKIQLLIVGVAAMVLIIALCIFRWASERNLEDRASRDVARAQNYLAGAVREKMESLTAETALLADLPVMKSLIMGGHPETVQDRATYYLSKIRARGLIILDDAGQTLGQAGAVDHISSNSELVKKIYDGEVWSGFIHSERLVAFAVGVPVKAGEYVRGGIITIEPLDHSIARGMAHEVGAGLAFYHRGFLVAHSLKGTPPPAQLPVNGSYRVGIHDVLLHSIPVPGSPDTNQLSVATLTDTSAEHAMIVKVQSAFAGMLILAASIGLLLATRLARQMTLPLELVVDAARQVERGEWPERFNQLSRDEFGLLQRAFNDMTEAIQSSQSRLMAMVDLDPLTELPNHRYFQDRLDKEVMACRIAETNLCLILLDIDHFGSFNSSRGRQDGDQLLRVISRTLREMEKPDELVSRYGGEEFAIAVSGLTLSETSERCDQLREAIRRRLREHFGLEITISAGVAEMGPSASYAEGLALAAELALSRAKQLGRNRTACFEPVGECEVGNQFELQNFMEDASFSTIQALAAAVDAKDTYTNGHSQRVATYAVEIARAAGASDTTCDLIFRAASLHDVGKIGVPDGILKKQGPLTDEERAIMQTHPVLGEVIVRKVPRLGDTLPGVLHHHEAWDGSGYPAGLKGEEIPWQARVLAIADTYDAMTSDRPYRKGMETKVAVSKIAAEAGRQFDPDLVAVFVRLMEQRDRLAA